MKKASAQRNFSVLFPQLCEEWNYEKNNMPPSDYLPSSNKRVWWICSKGHEWETSISSRTSKGATKCPYCQNKKACIENCLATKNPKLSSEWHPTKNGELTPFDVLPNSNKKVFWLGKCGHEWDAMINSRNLDNRGCPYCCNRKANDDNCLKDEKLISQWNHNKNGLPPNKYTSGSKKKVWWVCEYGHEWEAAICDRSKKNGTNCPYCSHNKFSIDNSLAIQRPDLLSEWDFSKNKISPYDIFPSIKDKVWWVCKEGHSWKSKVNNRANGNGCPICLNSKGELRIIAYFESRNVTYRRQFRLPECKNIKPLPFDFAVFDSDDTKKLMILIEFDGEQHFKPHYLFRNNDKAGSERLIKTRVNDQLKDEYCKNNNIRLLRIPYWEINNIEKILDEHITLQIN